MGILYYRFTKDFPEGNIEELRAQGKMSSKATVKGAFRAALKDRRVWALFFIYAASFGVELTINNMAALYFTDRFSLSITTAGLVAGIFGLMNLFARALGGIISDWCAQRGGLKARVTFLGVSLFIGGILLMVFSQMTVLPLAIAMMMTFALFIKMANGATYSVVPFINKKALGAVSGIIGAGGNLGGVIFGFLFRAESMSYATGLFWLGMIVTVTSLVAVAVKFSLEDEKETKEAFEAARRQLVSVQPILEESVR
ncbi:MAG: MFS transporter, partial [Candidatus Omnitrophica bacterium]|nr:MFS transporter [Candidatus Omnitrophota bacterium]